MINLQKKVKQKKNVVLLEFGRFNTPGIIRYSFEINIISNDNWFQ